MCLTKHVCPRRWERAGIKQNSVHLSVRLLFCTLVFFSGCYGKRPVHTTASRLRLKHGGHHAYSFPMLGSLVLLQQSLFSDDRGISLAESTVVKCMRIYPGQTNLGQGTWGEKHPVQKDEKKVERI